MQNQEKKNAFFKMPPYTFWIVDLNPDVSYRQKKMIKWEEQMIQNILLSSVTCNIYLFPQFVVRLSFSFHFCREMKNAVWSIKHKNLKLFVFLFTFQRTPLSYIQCEFENQIESQKLRHKHKWFQNIIDYCVLFVLFYLLFIKTLKTIKMDKITASLLIVGIMACWW